MTSWLDFWNGTHRIYVNDRHKAAHFDRIAEDVLALLPNPNIDLLDWGCGPALGSETLAVRGVRVCLYDKAVSSQHELCERFGRSKGIRVLTDESYAQLPGESFDLLLVNSVLQYLSESEFGALLPEFRRLLRPGGRLILADVVPPTASMADDVRSLMRSGWRHGFVLAALAGMAHSYFSGYRKLRRDLGLTLYSPERMLELLEKSDFRARLFPRNIGLAPHRMTYEATKS